MSNTVACKKGNVLNFKFEFLKIKILNSWLFLACMAIYVAYGNSQAKDESELQLLPAYTTATAMPDPSHACDLHQSSGQCQILDPEWGQGSNPCSGYQSGLLLLSHDGNSHSSSSNVLCNSHSWLFPWAVSSTRGSFSLLIWPIPTLPLGPGSNSSSSQKLLVHPPSRLHHSLLVFLTSFHHRTFHPLFHMHVFTWLSPDKHRAPLGLFIHSFRSPWVSIILATMLEAMNV